MGSTILATISLMPVTVVLMCVCTVIWFVMWNRRIGFEDVSSSYATVIQQRQFYRVITATFTHLDLMHIVFNMATLYSVGMFEVMRGSYYYVETSVLLIFVSEAFMLGIVHLLITRWRRPDFAHQAGVGYSGVLFGWLAIICVADPRGSMPMFGLSIPSLLMPFAALLITQLIIPRASFLGHLAGIFAGGVIELGAFQWLTGWWLWTTTVLLCFLMLVSVKANTNALPWLTRCIVISPEFIASTGLGATAEGLAAASAPQVRRFMDGGRLRVVRQVEADEEAGAPNAPSTIPAYQPSWLDRARGFFGQQRSHQPQQPRSPIPPPPAPAQSTAPVTLPADGTQSATAPSRSTLASAWASMRAPGARSAQGGYTQIATSLDDADSGAEQSAVVATGDLDASAASPTSAKPDQAGLTTQESRRAAMAAAAAARAVPRGAPARANGAAAVPE